MMKARPFVSIADDAASGDYKQKHRAPDRQSRCEQIGEKHKAIQGRHDVVQVGIVGEHPPGRLRGDGPGEAAIDEPFGGGLLGGDKPRARRPVKSARRKPHQPERDEPRFPGSWLRACNVYDLLAGRAPCQCHRSTETAAPAAHMAIGRSAHGADRHQRCAVEPCRGRRLRRAVPCVMVHPEMDGSELCQKAEHTIHRAQIAAPHPLIPAEGIAYGYRRERRAAQDQEHRFRILVDADELAVSRGAGKGGERPSLPFHPVRYRTATAMPAHRLRQRAFGAEHPAPETADKHHAQEHERPPDPPKYELGEEREIGPDVRGALRRRQKRRNNDEKRVGGDDNPLNGLDRPLAPHEPVAGGGQKAIDAAWRGVDRTAFVICSLAGAGEKINHGTITQSSA